MKKIKLILALSVLAITLNAQITVNPVNNYIAYGFGLTETEYITKYPSYIEEGYTNDSRKVYTFDLNDQYPLYVFFKDGKLDMIGKILENPNEFIKMLNSMFGYTYPTWSDGIINYTVNIEKDSIAIFIYIP